MEISKKCPLFLPTIYSYDIASCHYNILVKNGIDVSHIDKEDKLKRNIQIGLMMKDNPRLTKLLRETTESLMDNFININDIKEENLILRQYDGILTNKMLKITEGPIPIELRNTLTPMIISDDRQKFIAKSQNEIIIKGVSNNYDGMTSYYKKILNLNFYSKKNIFDGLQKIKDYFLSERDINIFAIPSENNYIVYIKRYGAIKVPEATLSIIDEEEIDLDVYYNLYVKTFMKSVARSFI
jgi:hypothetical protein